MVRRSQHLTFLDLFDTPTMEVNCPERVVSTVPLQALALLHGPFVERNAISLAERIRTNAPDYADARLTYAYQLLFARDPEPHELSRIRRFLSCLIGAADSNKSTTSAILHSLAERDAWVHTALVLLNSNEFLYVN
jgi:hypothetical protein